jgi:hypothetical protein
MPNDLDSNLRSLIESFARDLQAALRSSIAADLLAAVGGEPVRRGPGRPRGTSNAAPASGRRPGRPRKVAAADSGALGERVLNAVKQSPGQTVSQVASALGVKTETLKKPVAQLLASKQLSKKGQRRGTRYYAGGSSAGASAAPSAGKRMGRKQPRAAKAKKVVKAKKPAAAKAKRTPAEQAAINARMAKMRAAREAKTAQS